jgi:D-arabinose 1-dehydrogenase-like Zn-dependent alcohol dehydrogenase
VNGILLMLAGMFTSWTHKPATNSHPTSAVPEGPLKIENSIAMIQKRLSIRGWPSGTAKDSEDTVAFALDQGVECQIETFSLKDADKAYEQ